MEGMQGMSAVPSGPSFIPSIPCILAEWLLAFLPQGSSPLRNIRHAAYPSPNRASPAIQGIQGLAR
jgi:hypothetical protein